MYLALAGGVGGAKLALGLARILSPAELKIVVNTGDDFDHLGLRICPDLDTVMYTLAGIANKENGWGIAGETWNFLDALEKLGGETWFQLGDRDLATHIERTKRLADGTTLSEVTAYLVRKLGISHTIVPMTDDDVRTVVQTAAGPLSFQDYFVRLRCEPAITGLEFDGAAVAEPAPAVSQALGDKPEAIIVCPSNPYVSIAPMLAIPGIRKQLETTEAPVIAVSPIVGGQALKGPAAKMMQDLGSKPSAYAVAQHYRNLISGIVIDTCDADQASEIEALGMKVCITQTVMTTNADKETLAADVIRFARSFKPDK